LVGTSARVVALVGTFPVGHTLVTQLVLPTVSTKALVGLELCFICQLQIICIGFFNNLI
jgi:hypothetical protein